jgi:hypothetical protein
MANLSGAIRALESPCISCFTVPLAHRFGRHFGERGCGLVQEFAHFWQAIADAIFHSRPLESASRMVSGTGQLLREATPLRVFRGTANLFAAASPVPASAPAHSEAREIQLREGPASLLQVRSGQDFVAFPLEPVAQEFAVQQLTFDDKDTVLQLSLAPNP